MISIIILKLHKKTFENYNCNKSFEISSYQSLFERAFHYRNASLLGLTFSFLCLLSTPYFFPRNTFSFFTSVPHLYIENIILWKNIFYFTGSHIRWPPCGLHSSCLALPWYFLDITGKSYPMFLLVTLQGSFFSITVGSS